MKTNNALRLYHINRVKVDIAYDDFISKTYYDVMPAFSLPSNMCINDALLIVSYINKKIAREHNIDINSNTAIKLTNGQLTKYCFRQLEQGQTSASVLDLISACGYVRELTQDPIFKERYFKWFSPNVSRSQVAEIYKKCGMSLDHIEAKLKETQRQG